MTTNPPVVSQSTSVADYLEHGWKLVYIPSGSKGPRGLGWNQLENCVKRVESVYACFGVGLAHAYSGTMALDIDQWERAEEELAKHGISLSALFDAPDSVTINSGRLGHGKLLYRMPDGLVLPSKKLVDVDSNGSHFNYIDFRCGTANGLTVQDVLPPSVHPDTNLPYQWGGNGDWHNLPQIPDPLLDIWRNLVNADTKREITVNSQFDASWSDVKSALEYVTPGVSRNEWLQVGMALHHAGTQTNELDSAFMLWNDWSSRSIEKYKGECDLATRWRSFTAEKANHVTLGTLFHMASRAGWVRPIPDVSELFASVGPLLAPTQLSARIRPPVPVADLSLWPSVLATRAKEIGDSVGCDPVVPLFAGLAAVCGAVDARTTLELMPGFKVPPILWVMTIGNPADKKSPASKPMFKVLREIEAEDAPRYAKDVLAWEGKEAAYASAKKAFLEFSASPEALLGGAGPHVPDMPPKPVNLKIVVINVTSQKLVRLCADRPRGMFCQLDEMDGWANNLTNRNTTEDRSSWVVSYEGDSYDMDRVGAGSIHCDNLATSIYGNLQPDVLRKYLPSLSADGLLQRFIPVILNGDETKLGHPVPDYLTNISQYNNLIRLTYALPVQDYKLSPDAYEVFRSFQRWYEQRKKDEVLIMSSNLFMTAFGKLEGLAGRLTLAFHIMESPFSPLVSADIVERVIMIIKQYIIPSYKFAYNEFSNESSFEQWCADHIIHHCDKTTVWLSELRSSARRQLEGKSFNQQNQIIIAAMHELSQIGWVVRTDDGLKEHQGRAEWTINPELVNMFTDYRKKVILARQRIKDQFYDNPDDAPLVKGYYRGLESEVSEN